MLLMCFCHTIAARYGALAGFGLSLAKWTLIVKRSTDLVRDENAWLWWLVLAFGFLICIRCASILSWLNYEMLTTLTSSGRWCNSVRLRDPGRIFPPKPGNGFSSSTENHSRLLERILLDLWPFKVLNIMMTHCSWLSICLFYRLKEETNNGRATNHKNAVLLQKASTTNLYLLSELKQTTYCILIKRALQFHILLIVQNHPRPYTL